MLVLCAPDAFKGTLSAAHAAAAMAQGVELAGHEAIQLPVADGGEGTAEVLLGSLGGEMHHVETTDPLHRPIEGWWVQLPDGRAVVETAVASGLPLLGAADRNPMVASSWGTGQLIAAAMDAGATSVLLGVGGTATVDGGCGMLQALGVEWLDAQATPLRQPLTPERMLEIASVRATEPLPDITALVDTIVTLEGAAEVFAPQKGANTRQVEQLQEALSHLVTQIDPGGKASSTPGSGAGGGIAFAAAAMGGEIVSGAECVLESMQFQSHAANADLVLTGEGCLDGQTATGKAPLAVAQMAHRAGRPCVALAGCFGSGVDHLLQDACLDDAWSLLDHVPIEVAMGQPAEAITRVTRTCIEAWASAH
ncbi:MAG: glycerate kinase [Phycisphaerales bacterium]|nr:glycerate kinase [Phycisphaerales bacterium]